MSTPDVQPATATPTPWRNACAYLLDRYSHIDQVLPPGGVDELKQLLADPPEPLRPLLLWMVHDLDASALKTGAVATPTNNKDE